ncbi:methionine ABC transporter permease [Neomicrococcus lactis]|uniref:D-methionine transport system permease protein n=1 Tax=Neomicrococcus lactis TaxID=732241 RepID=A0A7W8Y935_9MICC|nr:methionine ABC transporter permease [Neomicrococcus lactis]MBB5597210.1 D-methionine transport system permease protein [Neomicrococcus lactis]
MDWLNAFFANPGISRALLPALGETLQMISISGVLTILIGLPLGILLFTSRPGGLAPVPWLHAILSNIIVNITRSIPYAILMVALIPFTQLLVGTAIGPIAATVSLTIATVPFFSRLVEVALREVNAGKIDAAQVMGSTRMQIIKKVLLPESLPGIISGITTTLVMLVGYSAMAGLIGGGGLGRLAYNYGYQRFDTTVMIVTIVIMVVLVQLIQIIGDRIARAVDHR